MMNPIITTVSVPGRICLGGESLDWMTGGPSIVTSIPLRTYVTVKQRTDTQETLSIQCLEPINYFQDIPLSSLSKPRGDRFDYVQMAVHVFSLVAGRSAALSLSIKSDIPINAGVSSSAAVIVAVIAALNIYWKAMLTVEEICALAFRVEHEVLRTGAGQMDFYACGLGGLLSLTCSQVPPTITRYPCIDNDIRILLVDTQTPHSTKTFLSSKRQRFIKGDPLILSYITQVSANVDRMRTLLFDIKLNIVEIGKILTASHSLLRDCLNCSTDPLESCVSRCLEAGAYGAKLTGSGMGGCMFALIRKEFVAVAKKELATLPVRVHEFTFSTDGIRVEGTH